MQPKLLQILLATSNPHKLDEIRAVFDQMKQRESSTNHDVELLTLRDVEAADWPEPLEDAPTFEGNALIKASDYAKRCGMLCMADDSGLVVDALDGAPGVISARFAGLTGSREVVDLANNRRLLERLGDTPIAERTARFVCHMVLVSPDESMLASVRGTIEGRILLPGGTADPAHPERGRGDNGFGYDPLFEVPSLGKTTAELSPDHKNEISHRGDASRKMWTALQKLTPG